MSRSSQTRMLRGFACAVILAATVAANAGCGLEVGAEYPAGYYDDYPPDAYIATTEPVYFEGHAAYWYGGRWYYRDGGRWNHYDREPAGLREHRGQGPPGRRNYEPGRSTGHAGRRSGGHR